jgi:hypothetical protein
VNFNHLKQYKSENFSPEFDKILGRDTNNLLQQTKENKTESESKDAPRKTHSIRSSKNIVS